EDQECEREDGHVDPERGQRHDPEPPHERRVDQGDERIGRERAERRDGQRQDLAIEGVAGAEGSADAAAAGRCRRRRGRAVVNHWWYWCRRLACDGWSRGQLCLCRFPGHTLSSSGHRDASVKAARGSDRKSTRLNSSHVKISYAVFCLKK